MKKLILASALLLALATSCNDDNDNAPNTSNMKGDYPAAVIPYDLSEEPYVAKMPVKITRHLDTGYWDITVSDFALPGGQTLNFTTPNINAVGTINWYLNYGGEFSDNSCKISSFNCSLINFYYYISNSGNTPSSTPLGTLVAMNFRAEVGGKNYRVATFPNLAYYGGSTTTTYTSDGKEQEYKAEEPMYMISVNAEAGTAEMTIYNAQFASNMPKIAAINVKGLKIQGDRSHGYKISGQNIVPTVGVGSAATAMPEFTFNNIEVYPSDNDLTSVQINFTAASRFKAIFTGSYDIAIK